MAKFGSYYNLCPLTDIKGLQGVSSDKEDGQVIVTYRRNLAIKYRMHDQRQIHSWRTKDSFSSPVVWCESLKKYFAVFGERYVRCWDGDEEYLDKLKKHKFNLNIKTLISSANGHCFVVFNNGTVLPLQLAMSNRKDSLHSSQKDLMSGVVQEITHCTIDNKIYIGTTMSDDSSFKFAWASFDMNNELDGESSTFELNRNTTAPNIRPVGSVISDVEGEACLLLLWSDGRLFRVHLRSVDTDAVDVHGEGLRAWTRGVAMVALGDKQQHVAVFGESSAGEGALLALFGVRTRRFGPTLALKVRGDSQGGGLWYCGGERILVHVGQNLVVVPVLLAQQELAHLLGGDENINDVDLAQVITHLDPTNRIVDFDESIVVHLIQQALPDAEEILKIITKAAVNDQHLVKSLRKHLSFTSSVQLIKQLCICLSDELEHPLSTSDKEKCIVWATCLMDANYQQLSLAVGDPAVEAVLEYCCNVLNTQMLYLNTLRELNPSLEQLLKRCKERTVADSPMIMYSIEPFQLY